MAQQRQHAVIQMDITLRLAKNYHAKPPPETGINIKYGIKTLRTEPRKLEKWLNNNNKGEKTTTQTGNKSRTKYNKDSHAATR